MRQSLSLFCSGTGCLTHPVLPLSGGELETLKSHQAIRNRSKRAESPKREWSNLCWSSPHRTCLDENRRICRRFSESSQTKHKERSPMSWHASSWASWYSEARLANRLVMFVIAHHVSDEEGEAHPSIDTICKETRLGRSTVVEAIYKLAEMGELAIRRGGKFRGDSNSYTLPKFNLWVQNVAPKGSVKRPVMRTRWVQSSPP